MSRRKFKRSARIDEFAGSVTYRYRVESAEGALEMWVRERVRNTDPEIETYGGVEMRSRSPRGQLSAPDHGKCEAISFAPCWHDGSSLAFKEDAWLEMWQHSKDPGPIWDRLEVKYPSYFRGDDEDDS